MRRFTMLLGLGIFLILGSTALADIPQLINFQGVLRDTAGNPVADSNYSVTFKIHNAPTLGNELWTETQTVTTANGLFSVLLGSVTPVPDSIFKDTSRFLGIAVTPDPEMTPRQKLVSVSHAFRAGNARDLYHQIMDVMPNSTIKFYVIPRYANSKVTLYLYGDGFAGAALAHTHTGMNSHGHAFSLTTSVQSADHSHSGTTAAVNLTHQHGALTTIFGDHRHNFAFQGSGGGVYLVEAGEASINGLSGTTTENHRASGSVMLDGGHQHGINNDLGDHLHSFTTGGISNGHTHSFSGNTSNEGNGLQTFGVFAGTLPSNVNVYVDGTLRAGPFNGQFSSGPVNLSSYITDNQQHVFEIKEEGGSGGRIIYNLFVE